jgi:hypothetical protein
MHVLVVFKSQLRKGSSSSCDVIPTKVKLKEPEDGLPVVTWDDVRYLLEFHFGLHRANVRPVHQSFLTGMLLRVFQLNRNTWDNDHRLMSMDHIRNDERIVLCRKPMSSVLCRYVPFRFSPKPVAEVGVQVDQARGVPATLETLETLETPTTLETLETLDDEDDKLRQIMMSSPFEAPLEGRVTKVNKKDPKKHPSDYEYNELKQPRPAATYVCDECSIAGHHFRTDCHLYKDTYTKDGDAIKRPTKISVAHGIPKRFLQKVVAAADASTSSAVLRLATGELVSDRRLELVSDRRAEFKVNSTVPPKRSYDDMCGRVWFDFEDHVLEQEAKQKKAEDEFYAKNPRKKLQSMCTHWLRGLCQKEWSCEYLHRYNMDTMPICSFFLHSVCAKADECAFKHVLPPSTLTANACLDYALGFCAKGGERCERQHLKRTTPSRADFEDNVKLFEVFIKTM